MVTKRVPLFIPQAEEDAFYAKCAAKAWKLIDPETNLEYRAGDPIEHDGATYNITYLEPPHKPSSSGFVSAKKPGDQYDSRYYASVWGLRWV